MLSLRLQRKPQAQFSISTPISRPPALSICQGWAGNRMRRGEIHWADIVPRSGAEQTGRRPVIVVSHDGFNQAAGWPSIIVVPISTSASQGRRGPTVVEIPAGAGGLPSTSFAVCHQVTTLDRAKLTDRVGTLPGEVLEALAAGLKAALDLD